jgi:hypothetical protein
MLLLPHAASCPCLPVYQPASHPVRLTACPHACLLVLLVLQVLVMVLLVVVLLPLLLLHLLLLPLLVLVLPYYVHVWA